MGCCLAAVGSELVTPGHAIFKHSGALIVLIVPPLPPLHYSSGSSPSRPAGVNQYLVALHTPQQTTTTSSTVGSLPKGDRKISDRQLNPIGTSAHHHRKHSASRNNFSRAR